MLQTIQVCVVERGKRPGMPTLPGVSIDGDRGDGARSATAENPVSRLAIAASTDALRHKVAVATIYASRCKKWRAHDSMHSLLSRHGEKSSCVYADMHVHGQAWIGSAVRCKREKGWVGCARGEHGASKTMTREGLETQRWKAAEGGRNVPRLGEFRMEQAGIEAWMETKVGNDTAGDRWTRGTNRGRGERAAGLKGCGHGQLPQRRALVAGDVCDELAGGLC